MEKIRLGRSELEVSARRRIEDIISDEVRVGGPSPESV